MLWSRHRQVPGRQDTMLVADSRGAHVLKEPDAAKMDTIAADMALAVWNGYMYVWDARRHALHGSKDVGLRARARSRSFLCKSS